MRCANCGGELIDGKCITCGGQTPANNPSEYYQGGQPAAPGRSAGQEVSVGRWLGRYFLTWIPFVGGLVYIIMLIVWACTDKFDKTSKNWAIATLIMAAINIVIGALIVWGLSAVIYQVINDPSFQSELNNYLMMY